MDLSHTAVPSSVADHRSWRRGQTWLSGCLLGLLLAMLLALTTSGTPTAPVQPPGPDSLSRGSGLATDPVAALVLDIGEHLAAFAGADALPLHPDPELHRLCMVDDGQGYELERFAGTPFLVPSIRSTRRCTLADDISTREATRLERPPQQRS